MKQIYKTILSILIMLSLVATVANAGPATIGFVKDKIENRQPIPDNTSEMTTAIGEPTTIGEPYFIQVCCLMNTMNGDYRLYYRLPLKIEVWDSNLNPVNGAIILVEIYRDNEDGTRTLVYNNTKTTDVNGIKKFGKSLQLNGEYNNFYIYVGAWKSARYSASRYEQAFTIKRRDSVI